MVKCCNFPMSYNFSRSEMSIIYDFNDSKVSYNFNAEDYRFRGYINIRGFDWEKNWIEFSGLDGGKYHSYSKISFREK